MASVASAIERKASDCPIITQATAQYIGFRTTRYGPSTTNFFGGSIGAGVPLPRCAKPQNAVATESAAPAAISGNTSKLAPRSYRRAPSGNIQYGIASVTNPRAIIV